MLMVITISLHAVERELVKNVFLGFEKTSNPTRDLVQPTECGYLLTHLGELSLST
jgi:hypothetical protein